jgi:hypothetical protein
VETPPRMRGRETGTLAPCTEPTHGQCSSSAPTPKHTRQTGAAPSARPKNGYTLPMRRTATCVTFASCENTETCAPDGAVPLAGPKNGNASPMRRTAACVSLVSCENIETCAPDGRRPVCETEMRRAATCVSLVSCENTETRAPDGRRPQHGSELPMRRTDTCVSLVSCDNFETRTPDRRRPVCVAEKRTRFSHPLNRYMRKFGVQRSHMNTHARWGTVPFAGPKNGPVFPIH